MAELEALQAAGEDVALVLAAQSLSGTTGGELLGKVRDLHAHAQRGLLIEWGSWGDGQTAEEIFQAMARRQIEYYVIRPSQSPDELFHQSVSTFLLEWAHARRVSPHTVHVVGESWTGRAHELREVLGRCAVPHAFLLADSPDGRALVDGVGQRRAASPGDLPERHRPREPDQPGAGECRRRHDRPRAARVRRRHRRRRAGRALGGGLRRLGGLPHAGRRRRRHRRPGDLELADPQLPRLPARRQRAPAGGERLRAGLGLRRQVRLHARRDRDPARGRPPPRQPLRRRRGQRPRGHPRHRRHLPPARGRRDRGAGRLRRLLRRPRLRGADDGRRGGVRRRRRELGRPGGAAPGRIRPPGDARGASRLAREGDVALPGPPDRRHAERRGAPRDRGRRRRRGRGRLAGAPGPALPADGATETVQPTSSS